MRQSHFLAYSMAVPVAALLGGVAIAVYRSVLAVPEPALAPRAGWVWWAALGAGIAVGAVFSVPQRRLLHRHRDFVAEQSIAGRRRGLGVELRWISILWPMLAAVGVAIGIAWWLAWPAVVTALGVFGAPLVLYRECRSIQTLARRKAAAVE